MSKTFNDIMDEVRERNKTKTLEELKRLAAQKKKSSKEKR